MIQINDTIVALDIIEEHFVCDLSVCKGECCIEGESGAPLTEDEAKSIESILPLIINDLQEDAKEVIKKQGIAYRDQDGDLVTSIVNAKDCVFTYYDEKGICKCLLEKAYKEKKTNFYKPISCHLYPIRLEKYRNFTAVNYHRWKVCKAAVLCGQNQRVKIYEFLEEPLIRKFGKTWYNELCVIAAEYLKTKNTTNKA